jgi:hypothetical protein
MTPDHVLDSDWILLSFAGMPREPVLRSNVTAEGGGARGGFTSAQSQPISTTLGVLSA